MAAVETKVQAAGLWTLASGVAVAVLNAVQNNSALLGKLPPLAQFVIIAALPPLLTFLAAYRAEHTERPDLAKNAPAPTHEPAPTPAAPPPPLAGPPTQVDPPLYTQPYGGWAPSQGYPTEGRAPWDGGIGGGTAPRPPQG